MQPPWPAPVAASPVRATVAVPGSKSVTNRALVLAALAQLPAPQGPATAAGPGSRSAPTRAFVRAALARLPTTLWPPPRSRDRPLMVRGLRSRGTVIDDWGHDWGIEPAPLTGPAEIDVG